MWKLEDYDAKEYAALGLNVHLRLARPRPA